VLIVAKNGLRFQPTKEGSCSDFDQAKQTAANRKPADLCGFSWDGQRHLEATKKKHAGSRKRLFRFVLGRHVVDRTGLTELFDIHHADLLPRILPTRAAHPSLLPSRKNSG
jgi:uncharacterized protein (TIGR03435 family)